jgi:pimeloyl-ACP methyl ester carboxylesterase
MGEARADARRMRSDHRPLARPVVIIAGYRAPRIAALRLEWMLRPLTSAGPRDFCCVSYAHAGTVERARDCVVQGINAWLRGRDGTSEIDVVGVSMGGLLARSLHARPHAALGALRIARLFTLSTPHRGATLARAIALDPAARALRPGSAFLQELDEHWARDPHEVRPYALLSDWWVGARNCAPPQRGSHWLAPHGVLARGFSHFAVSMDLRIGVDIARVLRGEPPFATQESAPPRD